MNINEQTKNYFCLTNTRDLLTDTLQWQYYVHELIDINLSKPLKVCQVLSELI